MLPVQDADLRKGGVEEKWRRDEEKKSAAKEGEIGLYLLRGECDADMHTASLQLLACLQLFPEASLRSDRPESTVAFLPFSQPLNLT